MLIKFEVTNFKNFNKKMTFDLTKSNAYEFNQECVINSIINKALIYGHNGIGKSNLGFAIFDLISHLTDKNFNTELYRNYLNAANTDTIAEFYYEFIFNDSTVCYQYGKENLEKLIYEKIKINGRDYATIDRRNSTIITTNAKGTENLKKDIGDSQISIISYIEKNTVLENNKDNHCFKQFLDFINRMLFFRSLKDNNYIGLEQGTKIIEADIIKQDNIQDFEKFLNQAGIKCKLSILDNSNKEKLAFKFDKKQIPFCEIASQGTQSLALFYYWLQRLVADSNVKFVFIDEFDAFYHHDLSKMIVKRLRSISAQVIITTHNTSIMSNDLLRPDCYFLLKNNSIKSLANSSPKELRKAHNIEKMYKAGAFSD